MAGFGAGVHADRATARISLHDDPTRSAIPGLPSTEAVVSANGCRNSGGRAGRRRSPSPHVSPFGAPEAEAGPLAGQAGDAHGSR
jgi:hypothetical protein